METNPSSNDKVWRTCSSCKKPIGFSSKYYECNVSTCTGKRTGYVFCSVPCWETHLPQARHRDAWAVEKTAPTRDQHLIELNEESQPSNSSQAVGGRRLIVKSPVNAAPVSKEVLVVISKMKQYVKDRADMNTSGDVADILSEIIRHACDDAIDQAKADGRKTLMARDFSKT